jgi:hypothetical protein
MPFVESEHWILVSEIDRRLVSRRIQQILHDARSGKWKVPKNDKRFLSPGEAIQSGQRGEIALSRYCDLKWANEYGLGNNMNGDLEFGIEVKATNYSDGNLFCSQKTLNDYLHRSGNTPIVLARTGLWPVVEFCGFIYAKEINKFPFYRTNQRHNIGYLVPQDKLRAMCEFKRLVAHWKLI